MTQVRIKRVYEDPEENDGYRILVDRLWPRGIKKERLKYDLWAKDITPSPTLRAWFHENISEHWNMFTTLYRKELDNSEKAKALIEQIKKHPMVTLLYASKEPTYNHARVLQEKIRSND